MKLPFLRPKPETSAVTKVVIAPVQQPQDMDDEDRHILRSVAQLELQTSIAMRDRVLTEIATSLRWVQTSLLAVNGGAAVAVLQSEATSAATRTASSAFFVLGIVLSLVAAVAGVSVTKDAPTRFSEITGYWTGVAIDLLRSEEIERDWLHYGEEMERRSKLPRTLGYTALACFIVGCVIFGAASL